MKKLIPIFAFFAIVLTGCATQQVASVRNDSVRVEYRYDSVYVMQHDSIFVKEQTKNDTVYLTTEKWLTRYKDKVVIQHDTVTIANNTTVVEEVEREKNGWEKFCGWFTIIVLVLIVLYIAYRVVKAVYLKK